MRVRMKTSFTKKQGDELQPPGTVISLPGADAKDRVKRGLAEAVGREDGEEKEPKEPKVD